MTFITRIYIRKENGEHVSLISLKDNPLISNILAKNYNFEECTWYELQKKHLNTLRISTKELEVGIRKLLIDAGLDDSYWEYQNMLKLFSESSMAINSVIDIFDVLKDDITLSYISEYETKTK